MAAVKKWLTRGGLAVGLLAVLAGGTAALNWSGVKARYAGYKLRTAATDEERTRWAGTLLDLGPAGDGALQSALGSGEGAAVVAAVKARLADTLPTDPRYAELCRPLVAGFSGFPDPAKVACLDLVPDLLKCPDPAAAEAARGAVRAGLAAAEGKTRAVALALRPEIGLLAEVVPLLADPSPEVRRAAVLAVGPLPAGGQPVVADDDLYKLLHDPDAEVRVAAVNALLDRGLTPDQVSLARRLADPDPAGRLSLLVELRRAGVANPGPWLERLSKDADPAVRLGAARVAAEARVNVRFARWLTALADADPDPTVRRWAAYYRAQASEIRPTGFDGRE
ncbi:MAG: HEAT repeat domain-containing protein [Gemmataceae bacterium]